MGRGLLSWWGRGGQCTFKLDDDEVSKLAMALPQLKSLSLGIPCPQSICATTVASLLPISVHCIELEDLAIHFNTTSIVDDFGNISKDPKFRELRSLPRCTLSYLDVDRIPLILDEPDFKIVVNGMIDIFLFLRRCAGLGQGWKDISERMGELQEMRMILSYYG